MLTLKEIEEDYKRIKSEFQSSDHRELGLKIADGLTEYKNTFEEVFDFLINSFKGKLRRDQKTPLVFHSVYLTRLAYLLGERDLPTLLTIALHDVLEDTEVSEANLLSQKFMADKEYLADCLKLLKEDVSLSREPKEGELPPRYVEHIKRLIGGPKEVVNTEILDRFSDLMDLEYIMVLPKRERDFRLRAKLIKVKSFVYNLTNGRDDFNPLSLGLFDSKVKECESGWGITGEFVKL